MTPNSPCQCLSGASLYYCPAPGSDVAATMAGCSPFPSHCLLPVGVSWAHLPSGLLYWTPGICFWRSLNQIEFQELLSSDKQDLTKPESPLCSSLQTASPILSILLPRHAFMQAPGMHLSHVKPSTTQGGGGGVGMTKMYKQSLNLGTRAQEQTLNRLN